MNISYLKKQLISANSAIFEVNKKGIVWRNNYFDSLFNFLNEYDLKNTMGASQEFGNWFYGAVASVMGIPESEALHAGAIMQQYQNKEKQKLRNNKTNTD